MLSANLGEIEVVARDDDKQTCKSLCFHDTIANRRCLQKYSKRWHVFQGVLLTILSRSASCRTLALRSEFYTEPFILSCLSASWPYGLLITRQIPDLSRILFVLSLQEEAEIKGHQQLARALEDTHTAHIHAHIDCVRSGKMWTVCGMRSSRLGSLLYGLNLHRKKSSVSTTKQRFNNKKAISNHKLAEKSTSVLIKNNAKMHTHTHHPVNKAVVVALAVVLPLFSGLEFISANRTEICGAVPPVSSMSELDKTQTIELLKGPNVTSKVDNLSRLASGLCWQDSTADTHLP